MTTLDEWDSLLAFADWMDEVDASPIPTRPGDVRGTDHTKETGDE